MPPWPRLLTVACSPPASGRIGVSSLSVRPRRGAPGWCLTRLLRGWIHSSARALKKAWPFRTCLASLVSCSSLVLSFCLSFFLSFSVSLSRPSRHLHPRGVVYAVANGRDVALAPATTATTPDSIALERPFWLLEDSLARRDLGKGTWATATALCGRSGGAAGPSPGWTRCVEREILSSGHGHRPSKFSRVEMLPAEAARITRR